MSPLILGAVLLAAALHAVWNALIKVSGDRLVIMAVTTATTSVLVIPILFYLPSPAPASWPYLISSACVHSFYMLVLIKAYGLGDFAQVYPLSRGSAPLLTAMLGFLLLNESMEPSEMLGMLLIVAGIFGLALETSAGVLQLSRPALFYSLLTGLCITAYSLVDGMGVRLSGNSLSFILWMFFLDGFLVPLVALARETKKAIDRHDKDRMETRSHGFTTLDDWLRHHRLGIQPGTHRTDCRPARDQCAIRDADLRSLYQGGVLRTTRTDNRANSRRHYFAGPLVCAEFTVHILPPPAQSAYFPSRQSFNWLPTIPLVSQ